MGKRGAINLRCVMRAIATIISLLCLVGCYSEPYKTHETGLVSIAYLWSLSSGYSTPIRHDLWIEGCVVANDKMGETSHCFVLYDGTAGIEIKVDANNVDMLVPLHSHLRIDCVGLSIGREGGKCVLGTKPESHYVVDRIPTEELYSYVTILDNSNHVETPRQRSIGEITVMDMLTWVTVEGVRFIDNGCSEWCYTDTLQRPQTTIHLITDQRDTMRVVVSKSVVYAPEPLPHGEHDLQGIVDWHDGDIALRVINHGAYVAKANRH